MAGVRKVTGWQWWIIALLTIIASTLAWGVILLNQNLHDVESVVERTESIAVGQEQFRDNFSNYMNCLIVNEEEVVIEVGEEAYVEICKQLLYLGIEPIPPTIKADPSLLTTTTTRRG